MQTYLRWTGQHRWIGVAFGSLMLGGFLTYAVSSSGWIDLDSTMGPVLWLSGMALTILSFASLCIFVRCPRCQVRLVWNAVSKDAHPNGLNGLLLTTKCPFCGFQPEA